MSAVDTAPTTTATRRTIEGFTDLILPRQSRGGSPATASFPVWQASPERAGSMPRCLRPHPRSSASRASAIADWVTFPFVR